MVAKVQERCGESEPNPVGKLETDSPRRGPYRLASVDDDRTDDREERQGRHHRHRADRRSRSQERSLLHDVAPPSFETVARGSSTKNGVGGKSRLPLELRI